MGHTYKDLDVWKMGMDLSLAVYKLTRSFPKEEQFGLTSQMRRAAISVPSNIAEGKLRGTDTEFRRFLLIALGSAGELETQIMLAKQLSGMSHLDFSETDASVISVMKMLNRFVSRIEDGVLSGKPMPNAQSPMPTPL